MPCPDRVSAKEPPGAVVVVPVPEQHQPGVAIALVATLSGVAERRGRTAASRHGHPERVGRERVGRAPARVRQRPRRAVPIGMVELARSALHLRHKPAVRAVVVDRRAVGLLSRRDQDSWWLNSKIANQLT